MRILFIGNSATYVHDIPETIAHLATEAGYPTECVRVVKGGWKLSQHAEAGSRALAEIDYSGVFTLESGNFLRNLEPAFFPVATKFMADTCRYYVAKIESYRQK